MKPPFLPALTALALTFTTACAPALEPFRVRAADLGKLPAQPAPGQPLIVEFAEGDVIPIELTFTGDLIELTPPAPGLAFRAKRRFFVRISAKGLETSTDGVHFGARPSEPGSFRLGLSVKPQGAKVEVEVKMPKHAPPER